jgi:hypothetical protein
MRTPIITSIEVMGCIAGDGHSMRFVTVDAHPARHLQDYSWWAKLWLIYLDDGRETVHGMFQMPLSKF